MSVLQDITALFEKQIGIKETPVNNVIYNTHYYGTAVNGAQFPWCAAFIWDVFRMAGHPELFLDGGKSAYCPYIEGWAKQHGQWVSAPPYRAGDLVLFDWDNDGTSDHIGFVVSVSGSQITTIEGNSDDAVVRLIRYADHIRGAYRPAYPDGDTPAPTPDTPDTPERPNTYVVQQGDSLWAIAQRFLGNGIKYPSIMELNGLKSAAIYPGQVLQIPTESDRRTFTITVSPDTYRFLFDAADAEKCSVGQIIDQLVGGQT